MSGTLNVAEYVRKDGSSPYRTWFDGLHAQAAAKVTTAVERLELGNTSGLSGSVPSASIASIGDRAIGSISRRIATH